MSCPSCRNSEAIDVRLHPAGEPEEIMECRSCGAVWSVHHGTVTLLRDPQAGSFLATQVGAVELPDTDASRR